MWTCLNVEQVFRPAAILGLWHIEDVPGNKFWLIGGLGNPGGAYKNTRHNVGFMVVDEISETFNIPLDKKKFNTVYGRGCIDDIDVLLAKPLAFMNRSGPPIQQLANYFRIQCEDMLVVHDDIDLAFGRLKIKEKGGHGGHNGIRSLIDTLGGGDFVRLRVGVGRSEAEVNVTDHVLGRFSVAERKLLNQIIKRARDAVVTVLCKGTKIGMNLFNSKIVETTD